MSFRRKFLSGYQTKLELRMCNRYRLRGRSLPLRFWSTTTKFSQAWRAQSSRWLKRNRSIAIAGRHRPWTHNALKATVGNGWASA